MDDDLRRQKFEYMTTAPVEKLLCRLALPSMGSMMISALYNMADTFFIGKVSTEATAAIGIVFPYMAFIQAVGFFCGHGSGNYISRALGMRDTHGASRMAAVGFFSAFIIGSASILPGFIFMDDILRGLGCINAVLADARGYFAFILIATPFMMTSLVLNNQMRLQGNARRALLGIMTGALLNIFLDPLLIFVFGLGIKGAAIATAFSQFCGFVVLFVMSGVGDGIMIHWQNFKPSLKAYREVAAGGLPSLLRQGIMCISATVLNHAAGVYGGAALAAFSIVNRASIIAVSALMGFGQGFQPVCGFNYGAGLYNRVRRAFWFCVKLGTAALLAISCLGFVFAPEVVSFFRANDPLVIEIGVFTLRCQCVTFPLMGMVIIVNMYLQNIRDTLPATATAVSRSGAFLIPALFVLSHLYGLLGIQLSQPVADVLSFLLSAPLGIAALNGMGKKRLG